MIQQKKFPGIKVVSPETAKTLKELGWCWETPWILKVKSNEALIPVRPIDCNVGDAYRFLPTISQVVSWLELWGIKFSWECDSYNGMVFYNGPKIYYDTETVDNFVPVPDGGWWEIDSILEDAIPFALDYLKTVLKSWKVVDKEIIGWEHIEKYKRMVKDGHIKDVKFYEFFKRMPYEQE